MATAARQAPQRRAVLMASLGLLLVAAFLVHLGVGGVWLSAAEVLRELLRGPGGEGPSVVVWDIRLPRAVAAALVGAMLGGVGASFQALFRNPLAEPYVVGVSSGAAVGGVLALVLGLDAAWGRLGVMGLAFVTGLGSLALVFALARRRGLVDVSTLLLSGVVVGSLLAALTTLILLASGYDTNRVLRWLLGSMTPMYWDRVWVLLVAAAAGLTALASQSRRLNAFAVGESTAHRLGINVGRLKLVVLLIGTALVAITVGSVGIIGFLGLVAPHIARRLLGVDWRCSLPGAVLIGASLLLLADVAAQRAIAGTELPVGVVTAVLGAPSLLILLRRS